MVTLRVAWFMSASARRLMPCFAKASAVCWPIPMMLISMKLFALNTQ